jgi:hypothetical protein
MKRSFDNANAAFYNGMPGFRPYLEKPYNLRLFKHYLTTLLEDYTRNSERIKAWLQAEEDASTQYTFNFPYENWFVNREQPAFNFLSSARTAAFNITTNSGNPITTSANTVSLAGTAPLRIFRVEAAGHPEASFTWTAESTWTLTDILLKTGTNALTVHGVDESGTVLLQDQITVNKTGNAPPLMVLKADPASWHVSLLDVLHMDVLDSVDPDGSLLTYTWSVTPSDAVLDVSQQDVATALFAHPGLYTITVKGQDTGGASTTIQREVSVYAPDGHSTFEGRVLDPFWDLENVGHRQNYCTGPYYSLTEIPGHLVLHVWDTLAIPLGGATPTYPIVWRALPSLTDWAFISQFGLRGQVFGDYLTGLMVEMTELNSPVRYAFGIEDGGTLAVRRITATGSSSLLRSTAWNSSQAELRIRRTSDKLWFEQRTSEVWTAVHSVDAAHSTAVKAGLFVATDTAQTVKVAFDYTTLVDPSATSAFQGLRISEIMYNPAGSGDYEYVELVNLGAAALDLTGMSFTAGIGYTFGPTLLDPGQYLVVVKNQAAFASRYKEPGISVAPGDFSGKLDNAGETIGISDTQDNPTLSVTYGTSNNWPAEANGTGRSIEAIDPGKDLNDPANWRASLADYGSPGR